MHKNKGVSSQKVAYLCSNSLTPGMVQRSGLLMGREQIGGCHLRFFQGKGGGDPFTVQGPGVEARVRLGLTLTCLWYPRPLNLSFLLC